MRSRQLLSVVVILLVLMVIKVTSVDVEQIQNQATSQIIQGTEVIVQTLIDNTISNAMIWLEVAYSELNQIPNGTLVVGALSLSFYGVPDAVGFFQIILTTLPELGASHSFYYGLSTCPMQFSVSPDTNEVDLGDKVGNWTVLYHTYDAVGNYTVTVSLGAQSGALDQTTVYTVPSIPFDVLYFDFDLSTLDDSSTYSVSVTMTTTSTSGFSWLVGSVIRSDDCPEFDLNGDLIQNSDQAYIPANVTAQSYTVTFPSIAAQLNYFALELSDVAIGSDIVLSWNATAEASSDDGDNWPTSTIVSFSIACVLLLLTIILIIVVAFLAIQLAKAKKQQYQSVD